MCYTLDGIEVKVDDKLYDIKYGWGNVVSIKHGVMTVQFDMNREYYFSNWKDNFRETFNRTLFWDEVKITPPPKPKHKVKKWRWYFERKSNCSYTQPSDGVSSLYYTSKEAFEAVHINHKAIERIDATERLMYEDQNTPETSDDDSL